MDYLTLNLKEHFPSIEQALAILELEIERGQKCGVKAIKVIHGYGSSGSGGGIKKALSAYLRVNKQRGKIKDYCSGERWPGGNASALRIKKECATVLGDIDLFYSNPGITVILI